MARRALFLLAIAAALFSSGCTASGIFRRNLSAFASSPRALPNKVREPKRSDVRLAALWVGHATLLVQMDDVFLLTDPVFTETVGAHFSRRLVEPGLSVEALPPIDLVAISHMHLDHLSVGSLELVGPKTKALVVPRGGLVYVPDGAYEADEVARWQTLTMGDLKVTAVPVKHPGFRYGADAAWMTESATAWVFQYHGLTVYFGGDTAYDEDAFKATAARFPEIDLALLPIGPVEPRAFMKRSHVDGKEALRAFLDLGASHMVPMHYDTFPHGMDEPGRALEVLREAMTSNGLGDDRVHILPIGGQLGLYPKSH